MAQFPMLLLCQALEEGISPNKSPQAPTLMSYGSGTLLCPPQNPCAEEPLSVTPAAELGPQGCFYSSRDVTSDSCYHPVIRPAISPSFF